MTQISQKHERPLSPHLQIYKPQITSTLSIFHRITALIMTIGLFGLVAYLLCAATSAEAYDSARKLAASGLGQLALFGMLTATIYHLFASIRRFLMDTGRGFEKETIYTTGYILIAATIVTSLALWLLGVNA